MLDPNAISARLMLLSLATGFFVIAEPAPTDLAFMVAFLLAAATFRMHVLGAGLGFVILFYVFLLTNTASATQCRSATFCARYMIITFYLMAVPLLMLHLSAVYGPGFRERLYSAFFLSVTISAVVGIAARLGVMPGPTTLYFRADDGLRLSPFFKDPNVYAPYVAAGLILLAGHLVAGTRRILPGIALLALMWVPMLLAFSRAAWLATAVSALVFLALMALLVPGRRVSRRLATLLASAILIILPVSGVLLVQFDLLAFFEHRLGLQSYDTDRFAGHARAVEVALDQPLGIGPGHFVGRTHFPASQFALAAHNVFLKVWVENGIAGLVTFLGIYFYLLAKLLGRALQRTPRLPIHAALIACLVGTLINGYFIDTLHWRHLFVVMGFALTEMLPAERTRPVEPAARPTAPRPPAPRPAGPAPPGPVTAP